MHMVEDATGRIMIHAEYVVSTCILQHGATSEVVFSVVEIPMPLSLPLSGLLAEVGLLLLNHVAGMASMEAAVWFLVKSQQCKFCFSKKKVLSARSNKIFFLPVEEGKPVH